MEYTKLKDLVNGTFTVTSVGIPVYKMWAEGEKRFVTSVTPQEGFRKVFPTDTDKGRLDLGTGQLGSLLVACMEDGKADLTNKTFKVTSNGKSGMDIRYYFDLAGSQGQVQPATPLATNEGENPAPPADREPPTEEIPF